MTDIEKKSDAVKAAKEEGKDLRDAAVAEAKSVKDKAVGTARAKAEGAKDGVAAQVDSIGNALRGASDELRHGSAQEQVLSMMADGVADFADGIRGKSVTDMIDGAANFGRRHPGAFLGGAALLGFAAVRMAKASAPDQSDEPRHG